jgi:hypothetical protein
MANKSQNKKHNLLKVLTSFHPNNAGKGED